MKALVTGATGFVGSNLTKKLLKLGWDVNVLVRDRKKLGKIADVKSLSVFEGDLADKKIIFAASRGADVIFNCAAALNYHNPTEKEFKMANVSGLKNVLEVTKASRACLVHISTVGIYGPTDSVGANEESPLNPQDIYSKTKVEGEKLILDYRRKYGLKVVVIRPTIAYGPGDTRPGLLNLFRLIQKGIFLPVGHGNNYFHTVYVDNLSHALILAATKKEAIGGDFVIGDETPPRIKELYKLVYRICGRRMPSIYLPLSLAFVIGKASDLFSGIGFPNILGSQRVKFLTENKRYRIDKAKKILGYRPKVGLKEGLVKTYTWYKKNDYL